MSDVHVIDQVVTDRFAAYNGDSAEVLRVIPSDSVGYIIFSPPFSSLYVYSASERDCGNVKDDDEFFRHFDFIVKELFRVLKPGRLLSMHLMLMPTSKERDGYIGLRDFRGDCIRAFQKHGFIFHSEVSIWKDPVTSMQRTKALGLLHKQIRKDSAMSRQSINDFLVTMRKPGENDDPISHTTEEFPVELWQRYASPVWVTRDWEQPSDLARAALLEVARELRAELPGDLDAASRARELENRATCMADALEQKAATIMGSDMAECSAREVPGDDDSGINPSNTLQRESARDENDERHIAPLQLSVIRRGVRLWSKPGDVVLSPFGGIGSEGYVALEEGRKAVVCELKCSYFRQLVLNLQSVVEREKQQDLFAGLEG